MIGAISTTGHGETILRYNLAQRILQRMNLSEENVQMATENALREMTQRICYLILVYRRLQPNNNCLICLFH